MHPDQLVRSGRVLQSLQEHPGDSQSALALMHGARLSTICFIGSSQAVASAAASVSVLQLPRWCYVHLVTLRCSGRHALQPCEMLGVT